MRFSVLFVVFISSSVWCQYNRRDFEAALQRKSELLSQHVKLLNEADSALLEWENQKAVFFANFRLVTNYEAQFESQLSTLYECSNKLASLNDSMHNKSVTQALIHDLVATKTIANEKLRWYDDFELEEYSWAISRPIDSCKYLENGNWYEKTECLLRFNSLLEAVSGTNRTTCDSVKTSLGELKSFNDSISSVIALIEPCLLRAYLPICQLEKRVRYLREAYIRKEIDYSFNAFYNMQFDVNYRDTTLLQPCDSTDVFAIVKSLDVVPSVSNQQFYRSHHYPTIYEFPDVPATFSGGREAFDTYIQQHIIKPANYTSGKIYVEFFVSKKGNISNVRIKQAIADCEDCSKEAIRLMRSMPNWIPATNKGKSVNSVVRLSFEFP